MTEDEEAEFKTAELLADVVTAPESLKERIWLGSKSPKKIEAPSIRMRSLLL